MILPIINRAKLLAGLVTPRNMAAAMETILFTINPPSLKNSKRLVCLTSDKNTV